MNIRYVTILCPARFCWVGREMLQSVQMSAVSLDIEPEPQWLPVELPLPEEPQRQKVDLDLDDDEPPSGVIVIELV